MSIKLSLLKSGETLISDIKEIVSEKTEQEKSQVVAYLLEDPHVVSVYNEIILSEEPTEENKRDIQVKLSPWILLSSDKKFTIPTDWVVTFSEPLENLKKMYEDKVNG